jgi:hypothetical protein
MMASDFHMHGPNTQKRQFQKNLHLPISDNCAVNHLDLAYVLFSASVSSGFDWPNKEFRVIFSNVF